jgi:hypothetical protein
MSIEMLVVAMVKRLNASQEALQGEAREILRRYYAFLNEPLREVRRGKRLRLKLCRDKAKTIIKIVWTKRIRRQVRAKNGKRIWATRKLTGRFSRVWVVRIAHDVERFEGYRAFERERAAWSRASGRVRRARSNLRMWLENRWEPRASDAERERAQALVASHGLGARDARPLAGAIALERELKGREGVLREGVERWWRECDERADVPFEPHVTKRGDGRARLEWRLKGSLWTAKGPRPNGANLKGGPTVRWMRKRGVPAAIHSDLSREARCLKRLQGHYRELVREFGSHKKAVGEACRTDVIRPARTLAS